MLGISNDYVVFAGKSGVYFRTLSASPSDPSGNGETGTSNSNGATTSYPSVVFPEDWKAKNCHIECISVSTNGKLLAIADSLHGLAMFERRDGSEGSKFVPLFTGTSEKRIIKLQFTDDSQYLTYLDKQGDIFAIRISTDHQHISKMKKIMGHTSFISDFITRVQNQQIISCDRDEKIRVSKFPDAFIIQGFKLGHTESVISMVLIEQNGYLLSTSVFGSVILWDFNKPVSGTTTEFLTKWNFKEFLADIANEEITLMKGCVNENVILLSVTCGG